MSDIDISQTHNEARLAGSLSSLDAGPNPARLRIFDGGRPAPGGAETTLLVEFILTKPSGTIANNQLTVTAADTSMVVNSGVATWGRFIDGNGDWWGDANVGAVDDAADTSPIKLASSTTLFAGGTVALSSAVFG